MRNGPRINKIALGSNFFLKSDEETKKENENSFLNLKANRDSVDNIKYVKFGYYQNTKILGKYEFDIINIVLIFFIRKRYLL